MSGLWYNLAVPALTVAYFFVVSVLAALPVWLGYRLQREFHKAWLSPYTLYLAGWGAFVLLSVVQYMLIGSLLPQPQWDQVAAATRPLFAITFAVTLYFLSAFMAQVTGGRLPRAYRVTYWVVWGAAAVALSMAGALVGDRAAGTLSVTSSLVAAVLKLGITYGWIAYALLTLGRIEDPLDRRGLRRFVLLLGGGFLAFDLAVRDVTGVRTPDVVISAVQVGANYPAVLWLRRFLRERALVRPADPLPADLKAGLIALGLSARESDVVELLLAGFSHKEIAERLSIAPETVKKHTYNAHRKLGVQNRVQLSYFIQNRLPRQGP
jgi:DNA-binding CsgD family transcriptional regulator/putative Mn2+ efflux pump MntP